MLFESIRLDFITELFLIIDAIPNTSHDQYFYQFIYYLRFNTEIYKFST